MSLLTDKQRQQLPAAIARHIDALGRRTKPESSVVSDLSAATSKACLRAGMPFSESPTTFVVPMGELWRMCRSQNATSFAAGGFTVGEEKPLTFVQALQPASHVARWANVREGGTFNVAIPNFTSRIDFGFYSEGEACVETALSGINAALSPKRLAGRCSYTRQLGVQTNDAILSEIVEGARRGVGAAVDAIAINGSGFAGEPLGLLNQSGVGSVTFSGAPTWSLALDVRKAIIDAFGTAENIRLIAATDVAKKWRNTQKFSGASVALWENGMVAEMPAFETTNVPAGNFIAGDWSRFAIQFFGPDTPMQISVDPFTDAANERVYLTFTTYVDLGAINPGVFCKNDGSAAQ